VSLYEWLLFLHVLAAFLLVSGLVSYGVVVIGGGVPVRAMLARPAAALWNVGGLGVLVFGVWLALNVDGYELWDAWIIVALVLWLIASGAGGQLERMMREGAADGARRHYAVMATATLVLLLDMIFKPWA
jgi:uncharacterized membrane protein